MVTLKKNTIENLIYGNWACIWKSCQDTNAMYKFPVYIEIHESRMMLKILNI